MRAWHFSFLIVVALFVTANVSVPAEDLFETIYDESDPLPFETPAALSCYALTVTVSEDSVSSTCFSQSHNSFNEKSTVQQRELSTRSGHAVLYGATILPHPFRC